MKGKQLLIYLAIIALCIFIAPVVVWLAAITLVAVGGDPGSGFVFAMIVAFIGFVIWVPKVSHAEKHRRLDKIFNRV